MFLNEVVMLDTAVLEFVSTFIFPSSISFGTWWGTRWGYKIVSTKLWCAQYSPELAFRNTDFCLPENLIFPALIQLHCYYQGDKDTGK